MCVIGRMIFRNPCLQGSGYGPDDWMIVVSLGVLTPIVAFVGEMSRRGLGQDIWMLEPAEISRILHLFWLCEILYSVLMATTKISILLLYLRIWQAGEPRNRNFRFICYILISFMCCFALAFGLAFGFSCAPIKYAWERWDGTKDGTCTNTMAAMYSCAAINIAMDFSVCLLPIPQLASLDISRGKKYGISLIFSMGLFVTICSVIRFKYLVEFADTTNPTWDYEPLALWSCNESNLSVLLACIPAMAGLFQRLWKRSVTKNGSDSRSRGTGRSGRRLEVDEVALTGVRESKEQSHGKHSTLRTIDRCADTIAVEETGVNEWRTTYPGW